MLGVHSYIQVVSLVRKEWGDTVIALGALL